MIQRVQTLWMILAAIIIFLTIKLPFYSGTLAATNTYHEMLATDNFLILILTSALGTGVVIDIFLYKQRSIQFRILIVAILAECLVIFLYINEIKKYATGNYGIWSVLHLLVIVFLTMAAKGIYNDSKLIKESNRLR
jgi:peptidoglycan/LPS O-acetylase OafA/YrhL